MQYALAGNISSSKIDTAAQGGVQVNVDVKTSCWC